MAKKPVKRDYEGLTLPELTEAERLEYIKNLEIPYTQEKKDILM